MKPFNMINVHTIDEAVSVLSKNNGNAQVLAGGTDIIGGLKRKIYPDPPELLVNLKTIPGMEYIREEGGMLKIGAQTTLDEIAESELVKARYSALGKAAEKTASPLLRYSGTIAGNICQDPRCWYYRSDDNYFNCLMKGGDVCYAMRGDNRYHSIMGSVSAHQPSCSHGCPTSVEISDYMAQIRAGEIDEAAGILLAANPIPAVTGRVCPHFCQQGCGRKEQDDAVSIRAAERFLGDHILENAKRFMTPPAKESGKKMAIVGSGPAGLSAAYYLRKAGHSVIVFEKMDKPGGMLTYSIPNYRLPNSIVEQQISAFKAMGIKFKTGVKIGTDITMETLSQEYDFVFTGTGAWSERAMGIEGENLCSSGLEFLNRVHGGEGDTAEGTVLVIGGGNVAIDVATTLKRMGADPCIVYRRSKTEMPAIEHEVDNAVDEGVNFEFLTLPVEVVSRGKELAVRCMKMERGKPDASGRASVKPVKGSDFIIKATAVMKAIGESADFSFLPDDLRTSAGEKQWGTPEAFLGKNVYAGGDMLSGPSTVAQAVGAGRRAARGISGQYKTDAEHTRTLEMQLFKPMVPESLEASDRILEIERSLSDKLERPMAEDMTGITLDQVKTEAKRCMNCGCIASSPSDMAPALIALDARIKTTLRTLKAADFFKPGNGRLNCLKHDELVTEIIFPDPEDCKQTYLKFRTRGTIDFPIVSVAAAMRIVDGKAREPRLILGAVAPVPVSAKKAEAFLEGKEINEQTAEEAGNLSVSRAKGLKKNKYKIEIAKTLVKRAVLACNDR